MSTYVAYGVFFFGGFVLGVAVGYAMGITRARQLIAERMREQPWPFGER